MTPLDLLREFARKHPEAPVPAGLWLAAEAAEQRHITDTALEAQVVGVKEAARIAGGRDEKEVRRWCREGLVGAYRVTPAGRWRIPLRALQMYLEGAKPTALGDKQVNSNGAHEVPRRRHGPWKRPGQPPPGAYLPAG